MLSMAKQNTPKRSPAIWRYFVGAASKQKSQATTRQCNKESPIELTCYNLTTRELTYGGVFTLLSFRAPQSSP